MDKITTHAPVPAASADETITLTRPDTPLDDEFHDPDPSTLPLPITQSVTSPALLHTPLISTEPDFSFPQPFQDSPAVSATLFFRSSSTSLRLTLPLHSIPLPLFHRLLVTLTLLSLLLFSPCLLILF